MIRFFPKVILLGSKPFDAVSPPRRGLGQLLICSQYPVFLNLEEEDDIMNTEVAETKLIKEKEKQTATGILGKYLLGVCSHQIR